MNELAYLNTGHVVGILFFCAGMVVFSGMIAIVELRRIARSIYEEALEGSSFAAHDTGVFPDYTPDN